MTLTLIVNVKVKGSRRELIALYNSLKPDNIDIPPAINLKMLISKDQLEIVVTSKIEEILKLKSTIDDITRCLTGVLEMLSHNY